MAERPPSGNKLIESALGGLEEMNQFPSEEARRRAIDDHVKAASKGWDLAIGVAILTVATAGVFFGLRFWLPHIVPPGFPRGAPKVAAFVGAIITHLVVLRALHRCGAAAEMRRRLLAEGVPVCLKCGYALAGLAASAEKCPECGGEISEGARKLLSARDCGNDGTVGAPGTRA